MEASAVSPLAYVAFGLAFVSGLGLIGCLYLLTRRLGMEWARSGLSAHLGSKDAVRVVKMLWGFERPADASNGRLLWIARGLWLSLTGLVLVFVFMLSGAA